MAERVYEFPSRKAMLDFLASFPKESWKIETAEYQVKLTPLIDAGGRKFHLILKVTGKSGPYGGGGSEDWP